MPFTALLIALFAGWRLPRTESKEALNVGLKIAYKVWRFCTKVVAPLIIAAVLIIVLFYPA